jgi:nitrate reductase (NAD(P)H)
MLNNCWHRVCIKAVDNQKLKFEHPCLPALFPGGWMERVKANGGNLLGVNWGEESNESKPFDAVKSIVMTKPGILKYYTMEEVKNHKDDAWFVVKNNVYDGTAFLSAHPGIFELTKADRTLS